MNYNGHPFDKSKLRADYEAAVQVINEERGGLLNGPLYQQMKEIVFETAYAALMDTIAPPATPRMHVLSAWPGSGKSTFSNAWAAAVVACGGSILFVVEQMESADQRYRDLVAISSLKGKVAIWTSDHRKGNRDPQKVKEPVAQFDKGELRHYPVAVVTHQGFKRDERRLYRDWDKGVRNFILVDEMVKEVTQYTVDVEAIAKVSKRIAEDAKAPEAALVAIDALHQFILSKSQERKPIEGLHSCDLSWFLSQEAQRYSDRPDNIGIKLVFGFAECLQKGWAFIATDGGVTTLTGYDNNLPIEHGTMQLDGTAKVGGYSRLGLPDRIIFDGPPVSLSALNTIIEKPPTKESLATYLTKADNCLTYRNWMLDVIRGNSEAGSKVLVVCRKALVDKKYFPAWEREDVRWRKANFTTDFQYDVDGIQVSVQWWGGPSTGHNAWQEADTVYLFDANWTPRYTVLADIQGLNRTPATSGPLKEQASLRKTTEQFKDYRTRNMMAAHVQAAARGRLRRWDSLAIYSDGNPDNPPAAIVPVCGAQKLVLGISDYRWLLEGWAEMFPGAPAPAVCAENRYRDYLPNVSTTATKGYKKDWDRQLIDVLSQPSLPIKVSTKWIGEQLGTEWRKISGVALKALPALEALGWTYVRGKGRAPSEFRR